ncbi:MAG: hypothetical protein OXF88_24945 [Rhodobacteraceae bacterium]|nr:hypothetical protein [Paracoccaceae bacterium]
MATVETVNGVSVVFGVTWGLRKGRWRAVVRGRTGFCDFEDGRRPRGAVPAAAFAVSAVHPDHEYEPCLVALSNDEQDRFMTVVVTDGSPTVFTEEIYDGAVAVRKWVQAIEAALENASLARVYLPEGQDELAALATDSEKAVLFDVAGLETPSGVHPFRRSGRWRWVLAAGGGLGITGGILTFAWYVFLAPLQGQGEQAAVTYRTETSRLDVEPLLGHCISELAEFWPMAPEWDLVEEGCVLDPNQRPQGLPLISGDGAYAYRLYHLARHWNEYLSGRAADSVTALFAGEVVAEPSRRVLYVPVRRTHRLVSPDYTPVLEVEAVLDQLLVGVVAASGSVSDGSVNASTALDLLAALSRLQHVDLEPVYVRRGLAESDTEFRIRPVQLLTEKIRDDNTGAQE